jgi:hypothetical protein
MGESMSAAEREYELLVDVADACEQFIADFWNHDVSEYPSLAHLAQRIKTFYSDADRG